jgi:hypothetical protein
MHAQALQAAFALLMPALALLPSGRAAAAAGQAESRKLTVTAAHVLRLAEDSLRRGSTADAKALLALLSDDPDPDIRNEARYRRALLLEKEGSLTDASVLLRQVLDQKPDVAAVRLKLATMLHQMGEGEAARRELRALQSADLPPNIARFVDRMAASLQSNKPFSLHVELALAPDSNINRATRSDTLGTLLGDFTFDEDSKAKSGLGVSARVRAQGRLGVFKDVALVGRTSLDANLYRHTDFNDLSLEVAVGPEWRLGRVRMKTEVSASEQWYGMKPYQRSLRLSVSAVAPLGRVSQLRIEAAARHANNRINDLQDGRGASAQLRFERALSPRLLVLGFVGADRFKAADAAYSTRSWRAGIGAVRDMGAMTMSLGLDIGRLKADDRLQLLPQARSDRSSRFSIGTVFRHLTVAGFAPVTRLIIERNRSTVRFYDYKRVRTEIGIARAF